MPGGDDIRTSTVALVGFLGAIVTFAVILLLIVIYYRVEGRWAEQERRQPYLEVENLLADQRAKLIEYRWVDREKQTVTIPIDRAMELVVRELSSTAASQPAESEKPAVTPPIEPESGKEEKSDEAS